MIDSLLGSVARGTKYRLTAVLVGLAVLLVELGGAVAAPSAPGEAERRGAPVPAGQNPFTMGALSRQEGLITGIYPNLRTGLSLNDSDSSRMFPLGGDTTVAGMSFSEPGDFYLELDEGQGAKSENRYAKAFEKTFAMEGFLALASAKLIDPAAGESVAAAINHGLAFKADRRDDARGAAGQGTALTPFELEVLQARNHCVQKRLKESADMSVAQASDLCDHDDLFSMSDHPQAPETTEKENTLLLSNLLFQKADDSDTSSSPTLLPGGSPTGGAAGVADSFELTAETFRKLFGDIEIKGEVKENRVEQSIKILSPWDAHFGEDSPTDRGTFESALGDAALLQDKCEKPVSLDFARYCWAFHFYNTIMWTVSEQCKYFNESARLPKQHEPMAPSGGLGSALSLLVGAPAGGAGEEQPGPWGVKRSDWERVSTDLSFPGYTFGVGTAEAFFYGYRRGIPRNTGLSGWDILQVLGGAASFFAEADSFFNNFFEWIDRPPTDPTLQINCAAVYSTVASFPLVAQNLDRVRFPTWIAAAARFANARALLFTRDIVISAWSVIQQYTSSLGYKDLGESARRLLTAAYDSNKEAVVQEELKKVAKILEQLELEYKLARTQRGGNANTSAR